MKSTFILVLLSLGLVQYSFAQQIKGLVKQIPTQVKDGKFPTGQKPSLTNDEVVAGLREALQIGIKNAVNQS